MNFKDFINSNWSIFMSHICEFHKLEKDFIDTYEYELDWTAISKNKQIDWDIDFLTKYEHKFKWHELAWNYAIIWNSDLIDTFKKRLDWYYLARNKNLPISESFIQKYLKKIHIAKYNVNLTDEIKAKYQELILGEDIFETQKITKEEIDNLTETLKSFKFYHGQKLLYDNYIAKQLNDYTLEQIFNDRYDYSQRYFYIQPVHHDIYGLTPEFVIEGKNPFEEQSGKELIEVTTTLNLVNGSLQEGKARLYEMPRFASYSTYPLLLLSEDVKSVIENFKLPKHIFIEVNLKPRKIKVSSKFYLLQFAKDTLTKDLNFKYTKFKYRTIQGYIKSSQVYSPYRRIEKKNDKLSDLKIVTNELNSEFSKEVETRIEVLPDEFVLKSDYDFYTFSAYNRIIINENVKRTLESLLPNQFEFLSAQDLKINMNQKIYDSKRKSLDKEIQSVKPMEVEMSESEKFFREKIERIEKTGVEFPKERTSNDAFRLKEEELKVLFPNEFTTFYKPNKSLNEYTLLNITDFRTEDEYYDRNPETYNSVIVAENGIGDSLGLILEKGSDFKLKAELYEFSHETGEVEKYSNIPPTMYIGNGGDSGDANTSAFKKLIDKFKGK